MKGRGKKKAETKIFGLVLPNQQKKQGENKQ